MGFFDTIEAFKKLTIIDCLTILIGIRHFQASPFTSSSDLTKSYRNRPFWVTILVCIINQKSYKFKERFFLCLNMDVWRNIHKEGFPVTNNWSLKVLCCILSNIRKIHILKNDIRMLLKPR